MCGWCGMRSEPRFIVTELEGFDTVDRRTGNPGLSCHVIDTHWNYRLVRTWRTEDYYRRGYAFACRYVRQRAQEHAAYLNAGKTPPAATIARERQRWSPDTCRNGHPRTPENTYVRASGKRECLMCKRAHNLAYPNR